MQALEEKLQYHFKNPALLEEALRHSSYANEHRGANFFSNERLEFLGDSVLGFVTAEYLFAKHPTAPEGELTRIRALLVCEDSLHEVAQRLELGRHLMLGNGEEGCGGRTRPSILADATAALQSRRSCRGRVRSRRRGDRQASDSACAARIPARWSCSRGAFPRRPPRARCRADFW